MESSAVVSSGMAVANSGVGSVRERVSSRDRTDSGVSRSSAAPSAGVACNDERVRSTAPDASASCGGFSVGPGSVICEREPHVC